ncbi:unnamed protein product [Aphanomyces euteiches]
MEDLSGGNVALLPTTPAVKPERLHVFARKPRRQRLKQLSTSTTTRIPWAKTKDKTWTVPKANVTASKTAKVRRQSYDAVLDAFRRDGQCQQYVISPANVEVSVASIQGTRHYMEDRYVVNEQLFPNASMIAIFDGHNGAWAAEYAASRIGQLFSSDEVLRRHACAPLLALEEIYSALRQCFEVLDDEILSWTLQNGKRDGSTALVMLLLQDVVFVANVGDSRAVLHRHNCATRRISVDHKPNSAAEKARVITAGGKVIFSGCWRVTHPKATLRLAVTRSLGDHPLKRNLDGAALVSAVPHVSHFVKMAGDWLVLASDGLWDRVSDGEIADFCSPRPSSSSSPSSAAAAASGLIDLALTRKSTDNITVVVASF